jgi:3-isopropylmalate dehydrogenase
MNILVLPGDGIGGEITKATITVLDAVNGRFSLGLKFNFAEIGFVALEKTGTTLPDGVLDQAMQSAGIILGPIWPFA